MSESEGKRPGDRPEEPGAVWARVAVRASVVLAAGSMAAGFLGWRAGALVAGLTACTYVLLGTAPRVPAPYGRGRLLRTLRRKGYRIVPEAASRHVAIGPGGIYLLETRAWQHTVWRSGGEWYVGAVPVGRVVARLTQRAGRIERVLEAGGDGRPWVVPVVMVSGQLPERVMRADRTVIARPREAVRYVLRRPEVLDPEEVEALTAEVEDHLFPE
ncbi:nuclease-related domain-containing protein [Haloactinospora alba]|uniref:nuclease-related domain-containing protein n=1 Tax=Haloactinospora alba TaxID=405555 RepID=UPI001FE41B87|nr:nuclease-related domain-containing protein [Haloactinospora alba]